VTEKLTTAEVIRRLERLAKRWPDHLWLFAASGQLCLMRKDAGGNRVLEGDQMSQEAMETSFPIECDGGDW